MVLPAVALVLISLVSPLLDAFVFRQPLSGARAFIARAPRKAVAALPNDDGWLVLPDIWDTLSQKFPNAPMLCDPIHGATTELSYGQFSEYMNAAAWGLQKAGTRPGDCVSMFAENSHRWLIVDQAVMKAGGCNAVRGAKSSWDELRFIYANSRSTALVLDTATLIDPLFDASVPGNPLRERPPAFVVVLFSRDMTGPELAAATCLRGMPGVKVLSFEELLAAGYAAKDEFQPPPRNPESTATLVYTSGTTANPKGAMLSHKNLLYQVLSNTFGQRVDPTPGDVFLSILPVWHIFERSAEYFCLARGARMVYSNLPNFKNDLAVWRPHYLIAVPRIFESIHKGVVSKLRQQSATTRRLISVLTAFCQMFIRAKNTWANLLVRARKPGALERLASAVAALLLWPVARLADFLVWREVRRGVGGRMKIMVSGGSALPAHIDSFFDMVGVKVVAGYGLTETSPTLLSRHGERNVLGTVGVPPPGTTIKIVDPETRQPVTVGQSGLLLAKGPGVMLGYMDDPAATAAAVDTEGYFNTGDLGRVNPATGDVLITGREKDTVVLSNGENVAPTPIEDAIVGCSPLVDGCMLVGQDQKFLGGLVVLSWQELLRRGLISESLLLDLDRAAVALASNNEVASQAARTFLRAEADKLTARDDVKDALRRDLEPVFAKLRPWERVQTFHVLLEPFTVNNGQLTSTQKIKRAVVAATYKAEIDRLYERKK